MSAQRDREQERQAARYRWLRQRATGRQHNELMDLDPDEWDGYIDRAMAREGLTPPPG
ncbi:MAG: hypothetical protein RJA36_3575 [Pseudomonadota bacterium]|jgi:hypothetical protein